MVPPTRCAQARGPPLALLVDWGGLLVASRPFLAGEASRRGEEDEGGGSVALATWFDDGGGCCWSAEGRPLENT